jgi:hypothetical protein
VVGRRIGAARCTQGRIHAFTGFFHQGMAAPAVCVAIVGGLVACGDTALLPPEAGMGSNPTLPQPVKRLIPTVNIAPAKGWPKARCPRPWPAWA